MPNNRPSQEERHRTAVQTVKLANERQRFKRGLEIVLEEMGMLPTERAMLLADIAACDFRLLGEWLHSRGHDGPGVDWCRETHQERTTASQIKETPPASL